MKTDRPWGPSCAVPRLPADHFKVIDHGDTDCEGKNMLEAEWVGPEGETRGQFFRTTRAQLLRQFQTRGAL